MVEPALRAAVDTLSNYMRHVAGYHFGWWDEHGEPGTADGGKAIRPALVLLSAQAVGGTAAMVVPAAVGVELVHNFSLLHDDVMDGDRTRRHRRTAWNVFGINAAILAGDVLLTLALDTVASCAHPHAQRAARMLGGAVQDLVDGQCADLAFERRTTVLMSECVDMVEHKTGSLLACACALGALLGGGSPEQVQHLHDFGRLIGLAFQHVDDLLGIWGDPAATGKPVHSDLRSRKKSLPVVAALNSDTPAGRELGTLYHHDQPMSDTDLAHAAKLIDIARGRAWCQAKADELMGDALLRLRAVDATTSIADDLTALARLITRRDH